MVNRRGMSGRPRQSDQRQFGNDDRWETLESGSRPLPAGRGRVPAIPEPYLYTMADLEQESGLPPRTIRYYISQGLLPPAHGRGPTATYDSGHILRLRLIQLLKARRLPLEEIKERLAALTDEQVGAMLDVQVGPVEDYWRHIQLHPDIELNVREHPGGPPDPTVAGIVNQLVNLARQLTSRRER